jgi:hypothetical protein
VLVEIDRALQGHNGFGIALGGRLQQPDREVDPGVIRFQGLGAFEQGEGISRLLELLIELRRADQQIRVGRGCLANMVQHVEGSVAFLELSIGESQVKMRHQVIGLRG